MSEDVLSLRKSLRQQRNHLHPYDRKIFDLSINRTLLKSGILLRLPRIASYLANDGEPALDFFLKNSAEMHCQHYLPTLYQQQLKFAAYSWGDTLKNNRFNIPEPEFKQFFSTKLLNMILVPLVGFDSQGHRIGMGGGFYDRTLSFMLNPACKRKPLLIGIAYNIQRVHIITPQRWDIPLDAIITELGLTCFSNRARLLLRTP